MLCSTQVSIDNYGTRTPILVPSTVLAPELLQIVMTRRHLVHCACILLLLCAQQFAFTHAAWHAGGGAPPESGQEESGQGALCSLHAAFSEVLGTLHATCPPAVAVAASVERYTASVPHAYPFRLHFPPARGPPLRS